MGRGGELFMLDMGEPVKIVDLASDLIRLSGLEVGVDIEIRFTGPRPGEKLCEEMFFDHEETTRTEHPKVLCAKDVLDPEDSERIDRLVEATMEGVTEDELRMMLRAIVPDYVWDPTIVNLPLGAGLPQLHGAEREKARSGNATSRPVRAAS
jgi:FlaA1/EpsC-like NDP-sugar epimerase